VVALARLDIELHHHVFTFGRSTSTEEGKRGTSYCGGRRGEKLLPCLIGAFNPGGRHWPTYRSDPRGFAKIANHRPEDGPGPGMRPGVPLPGT